MKYAFTVTLCLVFACTVYSADISLENCHCNEGYKAQKKDDGTIECVGINLYNSEPCNTKNPPPCKCSGDDVNSIVIDDKGTWCSSTPKTGSESKLWPCENKEEWIAYKSAIEQEKQ